MDAYSDFRPFTGFVSAAFTDWKLTASRAIEAVINPA